MFEPVVKVIESQLVQLKEQYEQQDAALRSHLQKIREEMETAAETKPDGEVKQVSKKNGIPFPIRKDVWKGMPITFAIQAYLSLCNGAVSFPHLLEALKISGVDLGKDPDRYERNLRSTLGNTRKRFAYNKRRNTVKLRLPN